MKQDKYDLIMSYLDAIENELNKIAAAVGHPQFSDFMAAN